MKKKLLLMTMFLAMTGMASAQNALTVADFTLPQNGGTITVNLTLDEAGVYTSYQFKVVTPAGIAYVVDSDKDAECELSAGHAASHSATAHWNESERVLGVGVASMKTALFTGQNLSIKIPVAATTLAAGTSVNFTIKEIAFIKQTGAKVYLDDVTFKATIEAPADGRTVLDELSATVPEAASGVDVRVKRTLAAGVWNTICLPFAMSAEQVTTAFGPEVQLADFNGIESTYDEAEENIIGIQVNFNDATAIEANHPYIIKVKDAISEFTVDGVDITPTEGLSVDKDEYSYTVKGKTYYMYNSFVGTFVANTEVPENCLFLNSNMFYYSTGATTMKAFRAYFDFYDILSEVENAEARISFAIAEDQATGISNVKREAEGDDKYYNLKGQRVEKPGKGIYIFKGKKVKK